MSAADLIQILRRRKYLVIVPIVLSLAYFGYRGWQEEPWYESSTVLLAEQLDDYEALEPGAPVWISDHIGAIRELVHRPSFLAALAERFDLYEPENGRITTGAIADLSSRVWVEQQGEDTFSMGYTGSDPEKVAVVTAGMAELFIERMQATRNTRASAVNEVVQAQLAHLQTKLDEQEASLEAYKVRSGQALPENLPVLVGGVAALRGEIQGQIGTIATLEADLEQVTAELAAMDDRGVVQRDPELEALRTELASLTKRYTEEHPEVVRARQQLAALEETRRGPAAGAGDAELRYIGLEARAGALERRLSSERDHLRTMQSRVATYEGQIAAMPQREREQGELLRDYQATRDAYEELLGRQHYTEVTHQLSRSSRGLAFVMVDPARVPTAPAGPVRSRSLLMGLAIGLTMAVMLTLLVEQFDTTMDDITDVEHVTAMTVLAAIPSISPKGHPAKDRRSGKLRLPTLYDPRSAASEQYRILAMSVRRILDEANARTLMVTSGGGGEGKTTTAVNLATAMADLYPGHVLLVDGDLRKPRIHEYLDAYLSSDSAPAAGGLRHLLMTPNADLESVVQKAGGLDVIAVDAPSADSHLLFPKRAPELFARLGRRYRYVIVDAPPVLPMVDGHLLAEAVDGVLFVVRSRKTPREVVERAMELFDRSGIIGIVLNDVRLGGRKYAAAYDYYEKHYAHAAAKETAT